MKKRGVILTTFILGIGFLLGTINASASQKESDQFNAELYEQHYDGDFVVDSDVTPYAVAVSSTFAERLYNAVVDALSGKNNITGRGIDTVEDDDNDLNVKFGR